ncbi:MAG TPA: hypothetical protein P5531_13785 [Bacteroidales bacterium]|nr:hypothetical protein [Bacteroidales bacterium]HSA44663.1 hypothetical protein [Bacteroidales bacterium]
MAGKYKSRNKSIAEQVASMRKKYPQFTVSFSSPSSMKVIGMLQPTSRSISYQFILKYNLTDYPKTKIISPTLHKNSKGEEIPHIYTGEKLCLYQPKYFEFNRKDFLCDTIIPWTSLWLYYYEIWHLTGVWLGGGEHPKKLNLF